MRIVLCYPFGRNRFEGGITQYCKKLEEYLVKNTSIKMVSVSSNAIKRSKDSRGKASLTNLLNTILYLFSIIRVTSDNSLIYIHGSNGLALLKDLSISFVLRKVLRQKVILHIHYFEINGQLLPSGKLEKILLTRLNLFADGFIVLGMGMRSYLLSRCPRANVYLHYNVSPLERTDVYECRSWKKTELNLLYVGSLDERKRFLETLEIVQKLRGTVDVRLHVMGTFQSETYRYKCKRLLDHLGEAVNMYGYVEDLEMKTKIFGKCDILILLSKSEGLPLVILEAMSQGLAIISTDVGAIPEIIESERNGVLLNSQDFKLDAMKWLERLSNNTDLLENFQRAAWDKSKEFTNEMIFPNLISSLETNFNEA